MIAILLIIITVTFGCDTTDVPPKWRIAIQVTDDENLPVPGAVVHIQNKKIKTDPSGFGQVIFRGREGDTISAEVSCPKNWKTPPVGGKHLVLKHINASEHSAETKIELEFHCIPTQKPHVLIVRTNEIPGLPVQVNNETAAFTDDSGVAQLVVSGKPNAQIHLCLNTEAHPTLMPQNPSLIVSLPPKRKIMLFEQAFNTKMPSRKKQKSRQRNHAPRRL